MTFIETCIFVVVVGMCVYANVDRICKAVENCALAGAFSNFKSEERESEDE